MYSPSNPYGLHSGTISGFSTYTDSSFLVNIRNLLNIVNYIIYNWNNFYINYDGDIILSASSSSLMVANNLIRSANSFSYFDL